MRFTLALVGLSLVAGCSAGEQNTRSKVTDASHVGAKADDDDDDDGDEQEQDIALSELPAAVRAAALSAFSGMVLESAELEVEDGVTIYSVEGTVNGKKCCVEISPDGKVLKKENDDEDDEEDEDEDGD